MQSGSLSFSITRQSSLGLAQSKQAPGKVVNKSIMPSSGLHLTARTHRWIEETSNTIERLDTIEDSDPSFVLIINACAVDEEACGEMGVLLDVLSHCIVDGLVVIDHNNGISLGFRQTAVQELIELERIKISGRDVLGVSGGELL